MTVTDIPINFEDMLNDSRENQIADPAGIHNGEMNPEIMTSLQMFQQQRYGKFVGLLYI